MKKILPCAIGLLSLIACNSNQPDQDPSIRVAPSVTKTDSLSQQSATANPATVPVQPTVTPVTPTQQTTPATAVPTTAGLNPAHGQPNHRCDIAVGAPLSTPIQQAAQPQMVQQVPQGIKPSVSTGSKPTAIPAGSTAKLNPPHGEPGHDCKIPVGQPLN
jgi:hypothetical protein